MAFMVGNEGVVDLDKPETIDGLKEEIDQLHVNKRNITEEIEAKVKRLDEICGADPDALKQIRQEAVQSNVDCGYDGMLEDNAEYEIATYHIFDLLEMYGEHDDGRSAKVEADIAATKMIRDEL